MLLKAFISYIRASLTATFVVVAVICTFCEIAIASQTNSIRIAGNLNLAGPVLIPPVAPGTFEELQGASSFSSVVTVIDASEAVRELNFYFWRTSSASVVVRAYVDSGLIGGSSGTPALVGEQELGFASDGNKSPDTSFYDIFIVIPWASTSASKITVKFTPFTLLSLESAVTSVSQFVSRGHLGDFDGDQVEDLVIFRPDQGLWAIQLSSASGTVIFKQWGLPGDFPITGDYSGDGVAELVVWRPTDGNWYMCLSEQNFDCSAVGGNAIYQFGLPGDRPLKADYDRDGILDLAVWRPSEGLFIYQSSRSNEVSVTQWGLPTDIPIQTLPNN